MSDYNIPNFNKRFFCIVNRDYPTLAALISSYVHVEGEYIPMFEYPDVTVALEDTDMDVIDEDVISKHRANEFNIRIRNALQATGGCENLILGNLSEMQKSYLNFLDDYNVIEINNITEVDPMLKELSLKKDYITCKEEDVHNGLYTAFNHNALLKIDESADTISTVYNKEEGLIVIENINAVSTIIAVNYAHSVNSSIKVITPPEISRKEIHNLIEKWKEDDNEQFLNDLSSFIFDRVEQIDFTLYKYATFFTFGAPYSLILKNVIPFTYVNNLYNPDFFLFNCILYEKTSNYFSSIVFSPLEFGSDEETSFIIDKLKESNYYVQELIGTSATSYNIDYHVKEYPYEILHICSHGGEVGGYEVVREITDRDGNRHIIEYDEVPSIQPDASEELIQVTVMYIFRKFNGLEWKSEKLEEKKYPHYIFSDMMNELDNDKWKSRKVKLVITDSRAIKCYHFNYQAMFNLIAGNHCNPFIFNNTCWSWINIAESFLSAGVKGYIGTMWEVSNDVAKDVAESFYDNLFDNTILEAMQTSLIHTKGTNNENIYMYWGLHFSTIKKGKSIAESKENVINGLIISHNRWIKHLKKVTNKNIQESIRRLIKFNYNQLLKNLTIEELLTKIFRR